VIIFQVSSVLGLLAALAAPQSSTTTHKKTTSAKHYTKSASAKATTAKPVAKATTAKAATKAPAKTSATAAPASKKKKPVVVVHRPQQPSQERLREIQTALAAKGYFNGEPDGTWGAASVDALKRFQHDQNLVEDGKIGSLSLIALGLGPKREPPVEAEQKQP
jgi:peptidoglycan hydrolase-like protein with peptidoglycan-binding domain